MSLEKFRTHLRESREAVWTVAKALFRQGFSPTVNYSEECPDNGIRNDYVDGGDIYINVKIEVKHRKKLSWTSRDDFTYRDIFVCAKKSFDYSKPKPYAYINIDDDMSHAAIIYSSTREHWEEFRMPDKRYGEGYVQTAYRVDKKHVQFVPMSEDLLAFSSIRKASQSH